MDKFRVLKHYAFQEVTADLLNSIADSLFAMQDGIAQAFIAGFKNDDHLIFQDLDVTPVPNSLSVKCGLKGVFLYRTDSENCVVGVYKGTRINKMSPYTEETLVFAPADSTYDRIDIIEAEIVEEDDVDYYDTVQLFNPSTLTSYAALKYVRRVRNVKLYVKTGVPSANPVAPTATPGRFTLREVRITNNVNTSLSVVSQTLDPSQSLWSRDHNVIHFPSIYDVIQYAKDTIAQNRTFEVERHEYKSIPGKYTMSPTVYFVPPPGITELTVELAGGGGGGGGGYDLGASGRWVSFGGDGEDSTIKLFPTGEVLMRALGGKGGAPKTGTLNSVPLVSTDYAKYGGEGGGEHGRRGGDSWVMSGQGIGGSGGGEYGGIAMPVLDYYKISEVIGKDIDIMAECGQIHIYEQYLAKSSTRDIYIIEKKNDSADPGATYLTTLRRTPLKADVGLLAMIPARVGDILAGFCIREMYMFYSSRIDRVDIESGVTVSYPCNLTGLVKALPGRVSSSLEISLNDVFLVFPTKICKYAPGTPTIFAGSDIPGDVTGPNRLSARFTNITAATYNTSSLDEIYVADNFKIKRIPLNTDVVETIIGTGVAGYSNDPVGTNAQIQTVSGLVVIGTNLYIADGDSANTYANIRVCNLLDPQYPINLLCGGGTTPNLNQYGAAVDVRFKMIKGMYTISGTLSSVFYVITAETYPFMTVDVVHISGDRFPYLGVPISGSASTSYPDGLLPASPHGRRGCGGAGASVSFSSEGYGGGGSSKVIGKITIPPGSTLLINLGSGGNAGKTGLYTHGYGYAGRGGHGYVKISW